MKLSKIEISKKNMASIPEPERRFFILITNVLNDVNMLFKLTILSNKHRENIIELKAQESLTFFILVLLAGKLWEGWKMLGKEFFGSKLSMQYDPVLSSKAKVALQNLKDYFGKGDNLINFIRNKVGFHYKHGDEILEILDESSDEERFELYLSQAQGNCFYYMATILTSSLILTRINRSDLPKALDSFFEQIVSQVSEWLQIFLQDCLILITKKYLDAKYEITEIDITGPPSINEVNIPYFLMK